ncbi:MAG: Tad domain-containing protein, partial [Bdellovibrionales bacterium]|nr:Tad domain-containing protein [Bdellovibrionales bacterium]
MTKRFLNDVGATTLFFIFVLVPIFFFLAGISLDVTLYYSQKRRAQRALDEAAMFALKYLPYQEAAAQSISAFLERYPEISDHVQIDVTADTVNLQLLAPAQLIFPAYFGYTGEIPFAALSRAQSMPLDAILMYDASSYLAPDLPLGAPWGDVVDWPAADLFSFDLTVLQDEDGDGSPSPIDSRLLTQQCFNGAFSAIKRAVISTHSFLSAFDLNAVGVGSFPGNVPFVSIHHPVLPQAEDGELGQTELHPFSSQYMKTDYCLAAAKREVNTLKYQMPLANSGLTNLWTPPTGAPFAYDPENFLFNQDYEPYMPLSEAVWSTTTRQGETGNLQDIFTNIRTTLMTVGPIERRGGLVHKARKAAVVIFGDMPYQDGER